MAKYFINSNNDYFETITDISEELYNAHINDGSIEVERRPTHLHTYSDGGWQEPSDEVYDEWLSETIRDERTYLLIIDVDKIISNPLRWASMSDELKQTYIDYRQALLDVTDQVGFPRNIVWPTKP